MHALGEALRMRPNHCRSKSLSPSPHPRGLPCASPFRQPHYSPSPPGSARHRLVRRAQTPPPSSAPVSANLTVCAASFPPPRTVSSALKPSHCDTNSGLPAPSVFNGHRASPEPREPKASRTLGCDRIDRAYRNHGSQRRCRTARRPRPQGCHRTTGCAQALPATRELAGPLRTSGRHLARWSNRYCKY